VAPLRELGCSVITSSREAQAEIRKAIVKNKVAERTKRFITWTNLTTGMFDASSGVK
jgi:hypothetical protein